MISLGSYTNQCIPGGGGVSGVSPSPTPVGAVGAACATTANSRISCSPRSYYFYTLTISNIATPSIDATTVASLVPSFQSIIKNTVNSASSGALVSPYDVFVARVSSSGKQLYSGSRALENNSRRLQLSSLTVVFSVYLSQSAATTLQASSTLSTSLGTYLASESTVSANIKATLIAATATWGSYGPPYFSDFYSNPFSVSSDYTLGTGLGLMFIPVDGVDSAKQAVTAGVTASVIVGVALAALIIVSSFSKIP